jgi:hypothetical protein
VGSFGMGNAGSLAHQQLPSGRQVIGESHRAQRVSTGLIIARHRPKVIPLNLNRLPQVPIGLTDDFAEFPESDCRPQIQ